ncbi:hypothetical protein AVEN_73601-1 [Araneus ventricosus]|uniref:Uncharacterized protein n=1 Tax=Araneus ventricosus TaxID=182803 RepID=A0A4Y2SSZ4_ARAVE|nr:hypothetical protein AVEN_73601-1 [Araneus ventricosus]
MINALRFHGALPKTAWFSLQSLSGDPRCRVRPVVAGEPYQSYHKILRHMSGDNPLLSGYIPHAMPSEGCVLVVSTTNHQPTLSIRIYRLNDDATRLIRHCGYA